VGTEQAGLLITGLEPVIKADGSMNKQASETVNTSQGGTGATVGIDNQMFVPGNIGVFSFVVGQVPGTYTDIDDLDYDDFLDVKDGGIFISQGQPNHQLHPHDQRVQRRRRGHRPRGGQELHRQQPRQR